jgi:hypothetical protein
MAAMRADGSRALRALVAEMAQLAEDDIQAILDDLDVGSRARLTALIETFRGGDNPAAYAPPPEGAATSAPGDWLLARLQPRDPAASGMTSHALQALHRAAQGAGWSGAPASVAAPDQRGLLARLGLRP